MTKLLTGMPRVVLKRTFRGYLDARGADLAASIAYASLVSFVPLFACITVLTSTLFGDSGTGIYRLVRLLVPGATRELVSGLQAITAKARAVSGWASFFFLFTSLRMYLLIEGSANTIWGTTLKRPPLRRIGAAVVVVLLGPIALGILTSLLLESGAPLAAFRTGGLLLSIAVLTLLYKLVPVAHVRWGPAFASGVFAGLAVGLFKYFLTKGVAALAELDRVYGSISAAFVAVFALGIAWTLLLLGVALAHALQFRHEHLAHEEAERIASKGPLEEAVRLLVPVAEEWKRTESADLSRRDVTLARLADETSWPPEILAERIEALVRTGLLVETGDRRYALSRTPSQISLYAIARAVGEASPRAVPGGNDTTSRILKNLYRRADREVRSVLQGVSLTDILRPHGMPQPERPAEEE